MMGSGPSPPSGVRMNKRFFSTVGAGIKGGGPEGVGVFGTSYKKTRRFSRGVTHLPSTCNTCPVLHLRGSRDGPEGGAKS